MTGATVADLFADLLGPAANADPGATPAKAANPANREQWRGLPADSQAANGLRIPANPGPQVPGTAPDSQTLAADSQSTNPRDRKHWRGLSQDSQDSQGDAPAWHIARADPDSPQRTAGRLIARASVAPDMVVRPPGAKPAELTAPAAYACPKRGAVELASADVGAPAQTCTDCAHRRPRGTCAEPIGAGLIDGAPGWGLAWGDDAHAATCPAFDPKASPEAVSPRYRLAPAEGDAAHADPWDDAAIGRFSARVAAIRRRGFAEQNADDLAERAHLLDVQAEGRALCLSCRHLAGSAGTGWRCGNHRSAGVARELAPELVTLPQRCPGFVSVEVMR